MTTFESKTVINKPIDEVYAFLNDVNNHQQLMPETVSNWSSTNDEASFNIQNMLKLYLKVTERTPNNTIRIGAIQNPPFPLEVCWILSASGSQTQATFTINANLNMMMKMMASGPLQKLADHETDALKQLLG